MDAIHVGDEVGQLGEIQGPGGSILGAGGLVRTGNGGAGVKDMR